LGSKILAGGVAGLLKSGKTVREIRGKVKNSNKASLQSFVTAGFANDGEVEGVVTFTYPVAR
jgi:hypothetical protein